MIKIGAQPISEIYAGGMGIKESYVGTDLVFSRPGGCIFIELVGGSYSFVPRDSTALLCADGMIFACKAEQVAESTFITNDCAEVICADGSTFTL